MDIEGRGLLRGEVLRRGLRPGAHQRFLKHPRTGGTQPCHGHEVPQTRHLHRGKQCHQHQQHRLSLRLGKRRATDPTLGAWGSFTASVRHKPAVGLLFADTPRHAHASQTTLEYVTSYRFAHDISRIRVTHDSNLISSSMYAHIMALNHASLAPGTWRYRTRHPVHHLHGRQQHPSPRAHALQPGRIPRPPPSIIFK